MKDYSASTYGDRIASVYDKRYSDFQDLGPVVATLADLAGGGPALELGIGTGRIALPLAARGVEVHGIDASEAMIARLRSKEGGDTISVTVDGFADVDVDGRFSLVFVAFNTFFGLLSQQDQVRCFQNVADHLSDGGVFAIEAFVPDLTRFVHGQNTMTSSLDTGSVQITSSLHDAECQRVTTQHVLIEEEGVSLYPVQIRYAWPSELDLMAQLAGLRLRKRWADWAQSPFTSSSAGHVSVYERCEHASAEGRGIR